MGLQLVVNILGKKLLRIKYLEIEQNPAGEHMALWYLVFALMDGTTLKILLCLFQRERFQVYPMSDSVM